MRRPFSIKCSARTIRFELITLNKKKQKKNIILEDGKNIKGKNRKQTDGGGKAEFIRPMNSVYFG